MLQDFDAAKPWFLIVNFPGPHEPMDGTSDMISRWRDMRFPLPALRDNADPDLQIDIRRRYAAMLENIDRLLGIYIETLKERGKFENTLIVFASDHCEMLSNRNLWKSRSRIRLRFAWPLWWQARVLRRVAMSPICWPVSSTCR